VELTARRVVVTGVGVVCALGDRPAAVHAALCEGRSGIAPIRGFACDGLGCPYGGEVHDFEARRYLGERNLRPLSRVSQLAASAAELALASSGFPAPLRAEREVGLALGTMFCSVRTIAEFDRRAQTAGPAYASAMDFANSVVNAAAGQTAIWHGLRGVNSTLSTGITSGLEAIGYAAGLIRTGQATAILAGGAEELSFESVYAFHQAGLLCGSAAGAEGADREHAPTPFGERRNGFVTGEGAALLMLEDAESARRRGVPVLAEVRGHASRYDCSRGRERGAAVAGVARAMCAALAAAGLAPRDVDAVSASANGSVAGDAHEAEALDTVFGGGGGPAVTATKAMLGETLGAGGGLQAVAMVQAMQAGVLPGIPNLGPEEGVLRSGRASPHPRTLELRRVLLNAVGTDGNCCAVVLGAPDAGPPA
jgi:3-oxoacyl-[acyl-carrier-protein] synthase II